MVAHRITAPELKATGLPVFPTRRCDSTFAVGTAALCSPIALQRAWSPPWEVHTTAGGGIRRLFAPSRFSEDCYVGATLAVIANTGEIMMMPATSIQPASVATGPNWRARLRLDSGLVRACAAAAGPAAAANPVTGGNQQ